MESSLCRFFGNPSFILFATVKVAGDFCPFSDLVRFDIGGILFVDHAADDDGAVFLVLHFPLLGVGVLPFVDYNLVAACCLAILQRHHVVGIACALYHIDTIGDLLLRGGSRWIRS